MLQWAVISLLEANIQYCLHSNEPTWEWRDRNEAEENKGRFLTGQRQVHDLLVFDLELRDISSGIAQGY